MEDKSLVKKSKWISKLLRHDPEDLDIDKNGWIEVKSLIEKIDIDNETLAKIVEENNKKRFEFSEDKLKIRARQGHSIDVDVELTLLQKVPPFLYHGTSVNNVDLIMKDGILKMNRLNVHLSADEETAKNVGSRHGKPVVLKINSAHMRADGIKIFLSNNGVYLTECVAPKYISI